MRKAVTYLQSCAQLGGGSGVNEEIVVEVSGRVPNNVLKNLWSKMEGLAFDPVYNAVQDIISQGFPMTKLLVQLHDDIIAKDLSDSDKGQICEKISHADQCLVDGASEELQLLDVVAFICRRLHGGAEKKTEIQAH